MNKYARQIRSIDGTQSIEVDATLEVARLRALICEHAKKHPFDLIDEIDQWLWEEAGVTV